jgi:hypothetical protein
MSSLFQNETIGKHETIHTLANEQWKILGEVNMIEIIIIALRVICESPVIILSETMAGLRFFRARAPPSLQFKNDSAYIPQPLSLTRWMNNTVSFRPPHVPILRKITPIFTYCCFAPPAPPKTGQRQTHKRIKSTVIYPARAPPPPPRFLKKNDAYDSNDKSLFQDLSSGLKIVFFN